MQLLSTFHVFTNIVCPTRYRTRHFFTNVTVPQQLGALQTHTTDTFLFISHTTNVLLFKFRCNIFIGVRIIKEISDSVASGTSCITALFCLILQIIETYFIILNLEIFFSLWFDSPQWTRAFSLSRVHDHTHTHCTRQDSFERVNSLSQIPVPDTTPHKTHKRQTSLPTSPAGKRLQTDSSERAAIVIDTQLLWSNIILSSQHVFFLFAYSSKKKYRILAGITHSCSSRHFIMQSL